MIWGVGWQNPNASQNDSQTLDLADDDDDDDDGGNNTSGDTDDEDEDDGYTGAFPYNP